MYHLQFFCIPARTQRFGFSFWGCTVCRSPSFLELDESHGGDFICILVKNARDACYLIEKSTWNQECRFWCWSVLIVADGNKLNGRRFPWSKCPKTRDQGLSTTYNTWDFMSCRVLSKYNFWKSRGMSVQGTLLALIIPNRKMLARLHKLLHEGKIRLSQRIKNT